MEMRQVATYPQSPTESFCSSLMNIVTHLRMSQKSSRNLQSPTYELDRVASFPPRKTKSNHTG